MQLGTKLFVFLCWLIALYGFGIYLFTSGFLLKRFVVEVNSSCHVDFTVKADQHGEEGCWMHKRYKRAVVIVIDALRYDFAAYNHSLSANDALPFQNKLTVIRDLMDKKPKNSRLYQFEADPPTTTSQRLKGLTTGSLPTFVDAGSNFASSEITEDNFIDQLLRADKRITFMGDDTWDGLFPGRFHKKFSFPSFNVKDLHTVDNGVIEHLVPEMKAGDWDVLIAHFLGVDHCGHRYGPYHPAMAEKLTQMDNVLRSVIKQLKDDTVLFVLGDHGMTRTGDHGGDSKDELDAALFVYSPSQITATPSPKGIQEKISQIDLVPTLSLLLGLPIPHSNLGTIIVDLFNHCPWWKTSSSQIKQVYHSVKALRLNAHQVHAYLKNYAKLSDEFPKVKSKKLDHLFTSAEDQLQSVVTAIYTSGESPDTLQKLHSLQKAYTDYLNGVKSMCQSIWAKFDIPYMLLGIVVTVVALFNSVYFLQAANRGQDGLQHSKWLSIGSFFFVLALLAVQHLVQAEFTGVMNATIIEILLLLAVGCFIVLLKKGANDGKEKKSLLQQLKSVKPENALASIILLFYGLGLFSNSYVVYEDLVSSFLLQTLMWFALYRISCYLAMNSKTSSELNQQYLQRKMRHLPFDIGRIFTSQRFLAFLLVASFNMCVKFASDFYACREEQWSCVPSHWLEPLTSDSYQYKNFRYIFSLVCLVGMYCAGNCWMRKCGNLNADSPSVICITKVIPVGVLVTIGYWALQSSDKIPIWQVVALPRVAYASIAATILVMAWNPLCIYILPNTNNDNELKITPGTEHNVVPKVYNYIKLNWRKHLHSQKAKGDDPLPQQVINNQEKPPLVYGLATVYSVAVLTVLMVMVLLVSILLGDGLQPAVFLMVLSMFLMLEIHACCAREQLTAQGLRVSWYSIVCWGLMSSQYFFATGHQPTIPSIRWNAAFVGFNGNYQTYAIPALLVTINTFSSQILHALGLPLLLLWPYTRGCIIHYFSKTKGPEPESKGELPLSENREALRLQLFSLLVAAMVFHGFKLLCMMGSAFLLRRHLMVWKIFAPRYVYEVLSLAVTNVVLILVYLFVLRIDNCLTSWLEKLESRSK